MALPQSAYKDRQFLAVIGDEVCTRLHEKRDARSPANTIQDSVTGILLAGVGVSHCTHLHYKESFGD
jgi:aminoglycoside N3'-acetyltransferase